MNEDLIDTADLSLSRKSVIPGAGFFLPDEEGPSEERIAALERAETVVVADPDADGLGCVALVREARDDPVAASVDPAEEFEAPEGHVALLPTSPHSLADAFEEAVEYLPAGVEVFVCDLCPDDPEDVEYLPDLVAAADSVTWFDHHQWDDDLAATVRDLGVDLVVGESDEECTTDVALRSIDHDFDERYRELATVTRDHDLWLREDPRSDDLADYSYWSSPERYVATVRAHGADLPEVVEAYIEERRVEKQALIDLAVERADIREVAGATVAVTYGRCSQNEVAETLRERGADATVVVKPAGSASIRGSEGFERCHEVAAQVQGGGHPRAAGCKPDIYHDMLDYANHWTTRGATTKQVILDAFRNLPPVEESTPDA
ncbi:DHH family phosphoesterase [Halomarina ordinaria]|uniref:DHH family phosphoesterase n=1 Tax=Halomarina ordinaria TaxID=3033939 RepID=A0ABD5U9B6_9EURY|nr:recombinase RecJ [Halomarina sp. PSRA2]